ncbi:AraC family transcriptional regulator [Fulvivirga sp. RKSG066]|uniref:helix-turn-helix domain-containing protein n=1 Tax=Fulvivirga aurantia TaxID=2529383 RepID=UPI0012BB84FE|nr:helix-turn-helix domain-containing protein [Fulvivirga aurantia]MTI20190.1 AraC family transcriptional regulator [Fulvivirga aurantia]
MDIQLIDLSLDRILLFFISAVGVLNTFFLASYFSFFTKNRNVNSYLLASLLFVIGLRETKSVLVLFYGTHVGFLAFFGQTVDALIGPLLYLYIASYTSGAGIKKCTWLPHTVTYILLMLVVYGYIMINDQAYSDYSKEIGGIIYLQWITYIGLSIRKIDEVIKKLFTKQKLVKREWWLITIVASVLIIWLAYVQTHYGNYVLGGVSISVVLYLSLMLWLYGGKSAFYESQDKYENRKIPDDEASQILNALDALMIDEKLYINPELKIKDVAARLNISPHLLSQVLNDNLKKSFKHYINEFRIHAATEMIKKNHQITLEAIGTDSGFKSKSTFYEAFKTVQGQTPAKFRKEYLSN